MRDLRISIPELAMVAGTRGALGIGLGMLLAGRFGGTTRRAIGFTLLAVGALTTIPLAFEVLGKRRSAINGELPRERSASKPAAYEGTLAD